jgi:1-acyl-sn-glycerol-3-phosphate acyltransferase
MTHSQLDTLTRINLDDLVASFGWEEQPALASILRTTFFGPAQKFAAQVVEFDNAVGETNLAEASRAIMRKRYVRDVRVHGRKHIPKSEPALFLSNHPGMSDTISLFAAIDRADLKVIAVHRPFLASLENLTRHLYYVSDGAAERMRAVRGVTAHLRQGGAALTFPAGEIEPDPLVHSDALASLTRWSDSAGVFVRFAPDTIIVPVLVGGVIWERAARHWLTSLKRTRLEREKLAAALQLLAVITRNLKPNTVHVRFARPVSLNEVGSTDSQAIHRVVIERMHDLIKSPIEDDGVSAL